jgi:hypothetical protein
VQFGFETEHKHAYTFYVLSFSKSSDKNTPKVRIFDVMTDYKFSVLLALSPPPHAYRPSLQILMSVSSKILGSSFRP